MEYAKIGLKVGLEIHQELETSHKLFCSCPPKLFKGPPEFIFTRLLRPSQSELGEIDPAALFEFLQGKMIIYEGDCETSCLVEMDEEPPHKLNEEALDTSLIVALMTDSNPVDEVHVMRKIVVDGSNTTGFQRTCVVSLGGSIKSGEKTYELEQICLEEDAARKIGDDASATRFRIDRLGIPLIEISTAPNIHDPKEAQEVAFAIGRILRSTGRVRRGLGTIRQDLNISVAGGAVIEIKGVQKLELISKVVEYETLRQLNLIEISSELQKRNIKDSDLQEEFIDVTELFRNTKSKIIKSATAKNQRVYALKLPGFSGLIGRELYPKRRLGTEMADRARFYGGVKGIFHTDELPGYDILEEEVRSLKDEVKASENDAVVIVAGEADECRNALSAVLKRAKEALQGVPAETRAANEDGTTFFTRPRPGAARMYPETDVISIPITSQRLESLRRLIPEPPEEKLKKLMKEYTLNEKLAKQILESDFQELFEKIVKEMNVSPTLVVVTLTETLKSIAREGCVVENITEKNLFEIFRLIGEGRMYKEAIYETLKWLSNNSEASPLEALKALNLETISREELRRIVELKISENKMMLEKLGEKALGPLIGILMKELRGKVSPDEIRNQLKSAITTFIKDRKE
ncbi:Glu-tRNA(Gln) amidotransferase subunit GatE [Candidatus Bathyarchaeota archaeon]|nr:Glu-tRNA(Gln) amidotransferase subunit GatE [Candidatus Bathyarchaeota archaeon]